MCEKNPNATGYIVATLIVAVSGAVILAIETKAIPKMMSSMMKDMMAH